VKHIARAGADHCPLVLEAEDVWKNHGWPFKFEKFWPNQRNVDVVVRQPWNHADRGSSTYCISKKLMRLKNDPREWSKESAGN